ncbi:Appr-1-p processing protein [Shrimp hemocyte iridescent virus]|uniref:Appr-1-p processing protein n=2 Tax=Decapodiridovirus litopenaeus1 TaxID=3428192 RepID=A0A291B0Z9_9VIRU|nr:Appr-1-p processing protein [Shrimp hemocyte iridescent virus]ATE87173.1 Appr-1-p processing protein [Shrimp hemocyte iridescent virus]
MITEIKGDITNIECDYICQQNNCIAVKSHGLSETIEKKLKACPYSRRTPVPGKNLAIPEHRPKLGQILTIQSPVKNVKVVCMFAQFSYGKVGSFYYYARDETKESRADAFQKCLNKMNKRIPSEKVVAFPKYIGCGLAGGDWNVYYKMIENFSKDRNVLIVNYN